MPVFRTEYKKGDHNYKTVVNLIRNDPKQFMAIVNYHNSKKRQPSEVLALLQEPHVRMFRYFDHSIRVIKYTEDGSDFREYIILRPISWDVKYG